MKRHSCLSHSGPVLQRGFSIVELMVSVVIGMLALMFATRMITGGESTRQAALGGSDSMQNGMLALYSMSNDATQAGFGLNDPILAGCDTLFNDKRGYTLAQANRDSAVIQPLAPVVITNGAKSDTISLYSGSSLTGTGTVRIVGDYTAGTSVTLDSEPYGFRANDVIVVAPEARDAKCSLAQVSVTPSAGATTKILRFDTGADQRFNSGDLNADYKANATRIFNLGPGDKLAFHTWSVKDGFLQLRATDLANSGATATTIADNLVSIKAQYGFDTRPTASFNPETGATVTKWSSTMIDADNDTVNGGAGDFQRIVAVRLAVVARGKAPQRPAPGAACNATPAAISVFGSEQPKGVTPAPVTLDLAIAGDTVDWNCYEYRVFETIVPIRNAAWRPTAW